MKTAPDHPRWEDAAGAYLLGALPDDEERRFEAHLADCHACQREVDDLRVATEALPASPPQIAPPPELKDRIMAIVTAEAELLQAAGARADQVPGPARVERKRWSLPSWLTPRLAPALAMVLIVGVVAGVSVDRATDGPSAPQVRTVAAVVDAPGASARLVISDDGAAELVASRLPDPGEGRVYQVWLMRPGSKEPEPTDALFTTNRDGSASVRVPGRLRGVERVLVTSEPEGGSRVPTRDAFIRATLA